MSPTSFQARKEAKFWLVGLRWLCLALFVAGARAQAPQIGAGGVVNGASFAPGTTPGAIVSVFGTNMAATTAQASVLPLSTNLGGTQLLINGIPAPLFYVSPGQINAQIPWEASASGNLSVQVLANGVPSNTVPVASGSFSPGLFLLPFGQGAVLIAGTANLAAPFGSFPGARPVRPGETISIFANGLGLVTNRPATGAGAPSNPPAATISIPSVTIGGVPASVTFSGLAPTFVGLYQVNAQIPANAPGGNAVAVVLTIGGLTGNTVTIAVDAPQQVLAPDLTLTKVAGSSSVVSGRSLVYTLTVQNTGTAAAQSVTVSDPLPAGVTFVSCTVAGGTCTASGATVTASLGTLAAGSNAVITLTTTAPTATTTTSITNAASVSTTSTESNTANNTASTTTTVTPPPPTDLTLTKTSAASTVSAGDNIVYSLNVQNIGGAAAENVVATDPLPPEAIFSSCTVTTGTCSVSGTTVTALLGTLAAGTNTVVTITTVSASVSNDVFVSNLASVSTTSNESNTNNNLAQADVVIIAPTITPPTGGGGGGGGGGGTVPAGPDLTLSIVPSLNPVAFSTPITFTVTAGNTGGSTGTAALTNLLLSITIPTNLQAPITCTTSAGGSLCPTTPVAGQQFTISFASLSGGGTATVTVSGTAPATTASLSISASGFTSPADANTSNNFVSLSVPVGSTSGGGGGGGGCTVNCGGVVIPPAGTSGASGGPIGGQVQALAINPALTTNLFAGTNGGGIFRSADGGANWTAINSGLGTFLNVQAVAVDPTTNPVTVYAGTNGGGLFRSIDGGSTWLPASVGLPANSNVQALAIDLSQGSIVGSPTPPVYVGTNAPTVGGVFRSPDRGQSWGNFSTGLGNLNVLTLLTDTLGNVYAGTNGAPGVSKSPGAAVGGNWSTFNTGLTNTVVNALVIEAGGANIYAGTAGGVFTSPTNAVNWVAFNTNLAGPPVVLSLAVDNSSNGINVYAGTPVGVFKSVNVTLAATGNWTAASFGLPQPNPIIQSLVVDPSTTATAAVTIYAGTRGTGAAKSINGGLSWTPSIAGLTAAFIQAVVIDPTTTPITIYAGNNGGGVFKNTDGTAATWTQMNTGLTDKNVQAMAIDLASVPPTVYVGTPSGVFRSANGGTNWILVGGAVGNVQALAVDTLTSPATIYAATTGGAVGVSRSTDGGFTWGNFNAGLTTQNIKALALDNAGFIYAGTNGSGIFKSATGAAAWLVANTGITVAAADLTVNSIAVDPTNASVVYAATNSGVYKTFNGNAAAGSINWTSHALIGTVVNAIVIDRSAPNILYVGTTNTSSPLMKSIDSGLSWSAFSTGLGLSPVQAIAINIPPNTANLLLGTSGGGMFVTTTGGSTWVSAGTGLTIPGPITQAGGGPPGGDIKAFAVSSGTVYAATNGGGVFQGSGGSSWTAFNTGLTNTFVQAVAVDPTNNIVYAGTATGVFKRGTADAGWVPANLGLGANLNIQALAVDIAHCVSGVGITSACAVFAGTAAGGVFKSANGGASWTAFNTGLVTSIQALAVDATGGNLYAGTAAGVFRSPTAFLAWGATGAGPVNTLSLAVDTVASPVAVYAGTTAGTIFKSTSSGASWTAFSTGLPGGLAIDALALDGVAAPNTNVYAGSNGVAGGVFKSVTSAGNGAWAAFTSVPTGLTNNVVQALAVISSSSVLAGTQGGGVFLSPVNGILATATWAVSNSGLAAATITALVTDPTTSTTLYAGTLGAGVFKSLDSGQTWQSFNPANFATFTNRLVQALAFDTSNNLYAGTLGGGVFVTPTIVSVPDPAVPAWVSFNAVPPGNLDVRALVLDSTNIYAGTAGGVFTSTPRGVTPTGNWTAFSGGALTNTNILSLARDTTNLYAGTSGGGVFKSLLAAGAPGGGWAAFNSGGVTGSIVPTLAVDVVNGIIYAGTTTAGVFKSATGAAAWAAINNGGLATANVQALAIDPTNPATIYAGTNGLGIFKTITATSAAPSWVPINLGITLANLPIQSFTISPTTPANVAAGSTGGGVFRTITATTNPPTWTAASP